jgi:hypothetical protein
LIIQYVCQLALTAAFVCGALESMRGDVEGRPARDPLGFEGLVKSILGITVLFMLLYGAGGLSTMPFGPFTR